MLCFVLLFVIVVCSCCCCGSWLIVFEFVVGVALVFVFACDVMWLPCFGFELMCGYEFRVAVRRYDVMVLCVFVCLGVCAVGLC